MKERHAEQAREVACRKKGNGRQRSEQSAAAQYERVSSQPVGGMRDKWTHEHPDGHGGCENEPDVLGRQPALAQESGDERRLHTEGTIEQGVCAQKKPKS